MFFADFLNLLVELVELVDCTSYVESKAAESARPPNLTISEYLLLYVFFGGFCFLHGCCYGTGLDSIYWVVFLEETSYFVCWDLAIEWIRSAGCIA
jgi:hypothetical protein